MAENLKGSRVITTLLSGPPTPKVDGSFNGAKPRMFSETVEATAAAAVNSTYHLFRLPSSTRISGFLSKIGWDDLSSGTAGCTLDIGVYNTGSDGDDFTDDPDAINDGLDADNLSAGVPFVKLLANFGKQLWEFTDASVDPMCDIDIKVKLVDHELTTGGGTIMAEVVCFEAG
jgi:hypothetical protein